MSAPADKVEKLQAQLEQSRRQNTDSNSGIPNSDALCKQLRDELESSQRTAAMENNRLQVSACSSGLRVLAFCTSSDVIESVGKNDAQAMDGAVWLKDHLSCPAPD